MDVIGVWLDDAAAARLARGLAALGFDPRPVAGAAALTPRLDGLVIGAGVLAAHGPAVRAFREARGEFGAPVVAVLDRDADEADVARALELADETAREPVGARELAARLRLLGRLGRAVAAGAAGGAPKTAATPWPMPVLARLVAGMAREIGSPVQYVGGNLEFLANTFARLVEALDGLGAVALRADGDEAALAQALAGLLDDEELRFFLEETPAAIRESREGLDRVTAIVHCVGRLVQDDGQAPRGVDVAGVVRDMLVVSRSLWKYAADVETDLEPGLPPVLCAPGKLCQAVLALLLGAADAIAARQGGRGGKGRIDVAALRRGETVEVVVRDGDAAGGAGDTPLPPREGLALVRSLLAGQGADLEVLSGREGQATVILRLPLAPGPVAIGA